MTDVPHENKGGVVDEGSLSIQSENSGGSQISRQSSDKEAGLETCRVCQCAESEKIGDIVLGFLGIEPPLRDSPKRIEDVKQECKSVPKDVESRDSFSDRQGSGFVEFVSPDGEVFICNTTDMEMGLSRQRDTLVELGCSCKNDLALVHYACALKWFVTHGSTICEICGCVARNIKAADFKKVLVSLKDYELLRERTANGEPNPSLVQTSSGVDPDAVAAIRRQRLSEISLWFNPHNGNHSVTGSVVDESSTVVAEGGILAENPATRWAVEGTGILLATGLLTVTLAWLIAPRVGKKTAKSGLHILLGGICALTVVILFRFIVLTRIKYGPARYWAILFVFWFLVFGIWASRSHSAHTT